MEIKLDTNSIEDRKQLISWLTLARDNVKDTTQVSELNHMIQRYQREIVYFEHKKKFAEARRNRRKEESDFYLAGGSMDTLKDFANKWIKERNKNLDKAKKTYKDILKKKYDDTLNFLRGVIVSDDILYGEVEKVGSESRRNELTQIMDMSIEFIHQLADDIEKHEFYNDPIDEWYFTYKDNWDSEESEKNIEKDYFFPQEVYILKIGDNYLYYSEISGQGTTMDISVFNDEDLAVLGRTHGYNLEEVKSRAYDLKDYFN